MKIVFLAPFGIRPKGTVLARMLPLAVELQALGHTVTIVAPPYTNPDDSGKTELLSGVRLVNVSLPAGGKLAGTLPLAYRMFRGMGEEQPDLVHLFKPKGYGGLAAMWQITLQRLGVRLPPLLVDSDDREGKGGMNDLHSYSWPEKKLFAFQEQWLSRHARGITVASRELERLTIAMGVPSQRLHYLPNCVAASRPGDGQALRRHLGIAVDSPLLVLYTRFFEFSQQRLHRVLAGIYQAFPTVRFLVVGQGKQGEEQQLLAAARTLGFDAALVMAGWVEPRQIPDYLAAADLAIYPLDDTLINRAKCPAKLTELLVAGLAVVADRVGQAEEYIRDGVSGILTDPQQPEQMVAGVVRLLREPDLAVRYAAEGKRQMLKGFNWREAAQSLDQFYRSVINS